MWCYRLSCPAAWGSSQIRDRIHVPSVSRQILSHWTTREVLHEVFQTALLLFLHFLTSLISNCLNLPFGSQGRSGRLKPFSCRQEMGDKERFLYLGGLHRACPVSKDKVEVWVGNCNILFQLETLAVLFHIHHESLKCLSAFSQLFYTYKFIIKTN